MAGFRIALVIVAEISRGEKFGRPIIEKPKNLSLKSQAWTKLSTAK
jgi:hypothetical protein